MIGFFADSLKDQVFNLQINLFHKKSVIFLVVIIFTTFLNIKSRLTHFLLQYLILNLALFEKNIYDLKELDLKKKTRTDVLGLSVCYKRFCLGLNFLFKLIFNVC